MITALTVPTLARDHANRYDPASQTIAATLTAEGEPGDTVWTTLRQRHTARPIHTIAHTLTAPTQQLTHATNLETDAFDADGIYRGTSGDYAIVAQDTDPSLAATPNQRRVSATFPIVIVSPDTLKAQWLRGVQLRDETRLQGSTTLPGATIAEHDARDIEPGRYVLAHNQTANTLAWHDGPPETYPASGTTPVTLTLTSGTRDQLLDLTVIPATLTAQPTGEHAVTLRYRPFTDTDIAREIRRATDELQAWIGRTGIEPRQHVTATLAHRYPYADDKHFPARPHTNADWTARQLPVIDAGVRQIRKVHATIGHIGSAETITLPEHWATVGGDLSSLVNFVPYGSASITYRQPAPMPIGYAFAYRGTRDIPAYWHMALTAGLIDLWTDVGALVREYVARSAATGIMLAASRVNLGAYASESFGRDGISAQRQATQGAAGTYGAEIATHQEWLSKARRTLTLRIAGIRGAR